MCSRLFDIAEKDDPDKRAAWQTRSGGGRCRTWLLTHTHNAAVSMVCACVCVCVRARACARTRSDDAEVVSHQVTSQERTSERVHDEPSQSEAGVARR